MVKVGLGQVKLFSLAPKSLQPNRKTLCHTTVSFGVQFHSVFRDLTLSRLKKNSAAIGTAASNTKVSHYYSAQGQSREMLSYAFKQQMRRQTGVSNTFHRYSLSNSFPYSNH